MSVRVHVPKLHGFTDVNVCTHVRVYVHLDTCAQVNDSICVRMCALRTCFYIQVFTRRVPERKHMHILMCAHVCAHTHRHGDVFVFCYTCTRVHTVTCMCVCACTGMHMRVCTCVHAYTDGLVPCICAEKRSTGARQGGRAWEGSADVCCAAKPGPCTRQRRGSGDANLKPSP